MTARPVRIFFGCDKVLVVLLALLIVPAVVYGQNPVQPNHTFVEEEIPVVTKKGEIIPLFWKATIEDAIVMLPLAKVEHFGIQDYDVDGATRVRELSITTNSQSMIRIYHIRPLVPLEDAEDRVKQLRAQAEGLVTETYELPVKVFPSTTHVPMVEYRVKRAALVDELFQSLERVMLDYHVRSLVPDQRDKTVREVTVKD